MRLKIAIGFLGAFLLQGVDVIKYDTTNRILYLSIPSRSYEYEKFNSKIHDANEYARSIKDRLEEFGFPTVIRYKEKDIYWTKEMGEENYRINSQKEFNKLPLWIF